ncbi:hypothetical protein MTR67_026123 [Solanum verrucosum]|uniref:Uncharacterized protein n=1 Tax=Solanum verrucosum TaxID=315347 RepID=A0AAF0TZM7_SOLVR|nr:hypothetical protein MTR67_026123 [Solanum verrucosum]
MLINSAIRPLVRLIAIFIYPSASSCFGSFSDIVLLHRTARRHADCSFSTPTAPFHRRFDPFL